MQAYTVAVKEVVPLLCYACSLQHARDELWTVACRTQRHATISLQRWYNRYQDAPYTVDNPYERKRRSMATWMLNG